MSIQPLPTVLIVDDERVNRTVLAELLQGECRIILAKDGPTALQRVQEEKVTLILLDASMPGMDGYEVLQQLKADERTANISVIFVTGQTDEQNEERGLLLGAVDYIAKPIRPLLVQARVRNHLKFARQREMLERLSMQDGLTGIANRRCFDLAFKRAYAQHRRYKTPLGLVMIDVDHFKAYNDSYGHAAGDNALCAISNVLAGVMRRPYDLAARYGGEEFVLLLPGSGDILMLMDEIRNRIAALKILHQRSDISDYLTISAGAVMVEADSLKTYQEILKYSDEALYQAKRNGRDQVVFNVLK